VPSSVPKNHSVVIGAQRSQKALVTEG